MGFVDGDAKVGKAKVYKCGVCFDGEKVKGLVEALMGFVQLTETNLIRVYKPDSTMGIELSCRLNEAKRALKAFNDETTNDGKK
jgi:hypothetical protein